EYLFPRVGPGYAELTVNMRQTPTGEPRDDLMLADLFTGRSTVAEAGHVWQDLPARDSRYIKLVKWNQPADLQERLIDALVADLGLDGDTDEVGFEQSLGGTVHDSGQERYVYFNAGKAGQSGAGASAENWQILSPLRQGQ